MEVMEGSAVPLPDRGDVGAVAAPLRPSGWGVLGRPSLPSLQWDMEPGSPMFLPRSLPPNWASGPGGGNVENLVSLPPAVPLLSVPEQQHFSVARTSSVLFGAGTVPHHYSSSAIASDPIFTAISSGNYNVFTSCYPPQPRMTSAPISSAERHGMRYSTPTTGVKPERAEQLEGLAGFEPLVDRMGWKLGEQDANLLSIMVWTQSLLVKVTSEPYRSKFIAGQMLTVGRPDVIMLSLDCILSDILPKFVPACPEVTWSRMDSAAQHLRQLSQESKEIFDLKSAGFEPDTLHSYQYWAQFLQQLSQCEFGRPPVSQNYKIENPSIIRNGGERNKLSQVDLDFLDKGLPVKSSTFTVRPPYTRGNHKSPVPIYSINSDSETETLLDYDDSPPVERYRRQNYSGEHSENRYGSSDNTRWPKKIVKPVAFEMDDTMSFRQFLSDFERYFDYKYTGNDMDRCRALAEFLTGPLLAAYRTLRGPQKRYSDMKVELLKQYDTLKIKGTRQWRAEFYKAIMKENETIVLYGARLKLIAQRAFPDADLERDSELRHRFCETVPDWFRQEMRVMESIDRRTGRGRHLSWTDRLELARELEGKRRKRTREPAAPVVSYGDSPDLTSLNLASVAAKSIAQPIPLGISSTSVSPSSVPVNQANTSRSAEEYAGATSRTCNYCKKVGHSEQACFAKKKQQRNTKTGARCMFCGRNNHAISNCRELVKDCVVCDDRNHQVRNCPLFKGENKQPPVRCPMCQGPHLGIRCPRYESQGN